MTTLDAAALPGHLIDGEWTGPGSERHTTNPAHPTRVVSRFAAAGSGEVEAAVAAAASAQPAWAATPAPERARLLRRVADRVDASADVIARAATLEMGKTLAEARGEVRRAVDTLHFNAAQALRPSGESFASSAAGEEVRTLRSPLGVVAVITPWNFPVAIPAWKIAPALAHGNAVVWKPAEETPAAGVALAQAFAEAGLPPGVLNVVLGDARAGRALVDADIAAVTFTGSAAVGQEVLARAAPRGVRVQTELGGHNPAVVFDDADLDRAADHVTQGAMGATGQKCTATRRVLVAEEIYPTFVERLLARVRGLVVGDGMAEEVDLGPLVSADARAGVIAAVDEAANEGAAVLVGGHGLDDEGLDGGHYVAPAVLALSHPSARICQEEVFGPVTVLLPFRTDEEAFALANATRYGLSAAVHTGSQARARRSLEAIHAGLVTVNGPTTGAELHAPFGGWKASAAPAPPEQGETARDFFTITKTAYVHDRGW